MRTLVFSQGRWKPHSLARPVTDGRFHEFQWMRLRLTPPPNAPPGPKWAQLFGRYLTTYFVPALLRQRMLVCLAAPAASGRASPAMQATSMRAGMRMSADYPDRDGRSNTDGRLPLRRRALRVERAAQRRRLLPLQPLRQAHRRRLLGAGEHRGEHVPDRAGRGARQGVAPPRRRLGEVLLRRVRCPALQPQSRRPGADERSLRGLRRGSRRAPELALLGRLRAGLVARPRRRPRALPGEPASLRR